jgi:hypothetical protein
MRYLFKSYWEAIVKFNTNATYSLLANRLTTGKCKSHLALVLKVWKSEFSLKKSLFLTTNVNKENIYWEWNGKIDNFLNKFRQETPLSNLVIIHIILFWILNIVLEWESKIMTIKFIIQIRDSPLQNLVKILIIPYKLCGLSPQANYTDWATATCWRYLVPTFAGRGVSRGQCGGSLMVVSVF